MTVNYVARHLRHDARTAVDPNELGKALRRCYDLPFLQDSKLAQLPCVARRAGGERDGLVLARALRSELIASAERISRPVRHPAVRKIVAAIEKQRLGQDGQFLAEMQKNLGIPFPRNKIDVARYYAIRLVMEGMKHEVVADFLEIDLRTLGNYLAEARHRIRLILEG